MSVRIKSKSLRTFIEVFLERLKAQLGSNFYGFYLYHSVARNEFERKSSDIDFIVVTYEELSEAEKLAMASLHQKLVRQFILGRKLDGIYLSKRHIGKINCDVDKYPYVIEGRFEPTGYYDLNHLTWWSVKYEGFNIESPDISKHLDVNWEVIHQSMLDNLTHYWDHKVNDERLFLEDDWVEFSVVTLCRMVYSLEHHCLISKREACQYIKAQFEEWTDVVDEAIRLRDHERKGKFQSLTIRKDRTIAFIKDMSAYGYQFKM